MTVLWLASLVSLAAFVPVVLVAGLLTWLTWPALRAWSEKMSPSGRARALFTWRLAPLAAAVAAAGLAALAFLACEPPGSQETAGYSLLGMAAGGGGLLAAAAGQMTRAMLRSRRLVRAWTCSAPVTVLPEAGAQAWCIDMAFPLVAVVGLWRPSLVVARSVLDRCTPAELAAIVAHERAHVAARDNIKRLFMHATSGVFGSVVSRRESDWAWQDATEEAADDRALASGANRLDLANAMVTVARMGAAAPRCVLPAGSSFYRGGSVERRVRRLLADADHHPAAARWSGAPAPRRAISPASLLAMIGTVIGGGLVLLGSAPLRAVYEVAEWAVQTLP